MRPAGHETLPIPQDSRGSALCVLSHSFLVPLVPKRLDSPLFTKVSSEQASIALETGKRLQDLLRIDFCQ